MPAGAAALRGLPGDRVVPLRGGGAAVDRHGPGPRAARRPEPAFPTTNRWLRGRILDRARAADDGAWVAFGGPIGTHERRAIYDAIEALSAEGMLETRATDDGVEARLPA